MKNWKVEYDTVFGVKRMVLVSAETAEEAERIVNNTDIEDSAKNKNARVRRD